MVIYLTENRHKSKKNYKNYKPYSKHNFIYNYDKDFYLCPNNEKLKFKQTYNYNNINMRQYYTNKCLNCPNWNVRENIVIRL